MREIKFVLKGFLLYILASSAGMTFDENKFAYFVLVVIYWFLIQLFFNKKYV